MKLSYDTILDYYLRNWYKFIKHVINYRLAYTRACVLAAGPGIIHLQLRITHIITIMNFYIDTLYYNYCDGPQPERN